MFLTSKLEIIVSLCNIFTLKMNDNVKKIFHSNNDFICTSQVTRLLEQGIFDFLSFKFECMDFPQYISGYENSFPHIGLNFSFP